jgi:hypothetical protein
MTTFSPLFHQEIEDRYHDNAGMASDDRPPLAAETPEPKGKVNVNHREASAEFRSTRSGSAPNKALYGDIVQDLASEFAGSIMSYVQTQTATSDRDDNGNITTVDKNDVTEDADNPRSSGKYPDSIDVSENGTLCITIDDRDFGKNFDKVQDVNVNEVESLKEMDKYSFSVIQTGVIQTDFVDTNGSDPDQTMYSVRNDAVAEHRACSVVTNRKEKNTRLSGYYESDITLCSDYDAQSTSNLSGPSHGL